MEFWTGAIGITKMRMIPSALANGYDLFAQDAAAAEEMGFDAYGAPEHHFTYDSFLPFPSAHWRRRRPTRPRSAWSPARCCSRSTTRSRPPSTRPRSTCFPAGG